MSRRSNVPLASLLAFIAIGLSAAPAAAQLPPSVRVTSESARILRWFREPVREVLFEAGRGTELQVLDKDHDWFWVVIPADVHGTRKVGWIQDRNVEEVAEQTAAARPRPSGRIEFMQTIGVPPASTAPSAVAIAEDKVTITPVPSAQTASTTSNATAARKDYRFDDVHFDRDRSALKPEEMDILRTAVTALKADPQLVVNIEGYTCSLGSTDYNLGLGSRRANAVKEYLMSEGIAADRLRTTSLGEDHPKHDNSHEETRRLNRRVALVPAAQPQASSIP